MKKIIIGITGASGIAYAEKLLKFLAEKEIEIFLTVSENAKPVFEDELGLQISLSDFDQKKFLGKEFSNIRYQHFSDFSSPIASGSFQADAMIIVPCSMNTIGAIANGLTNNLIHRAADVFLKERRKIVFVPRETPLNSIHLRNMLKLSEAGAVVLPAMPGFYHKPETIEDQIDFIIGKVLDQIGMRHSLYKRWDVDEVDGN